VIVLSGEIAGLAQDPQPGFGMFLRIVRTYQILR